MGSIVTDTANVTSRYLALTLSDNKARITPIRNYRKETTLAKSDFRTTERTLIHLYDVKDREAKRKEASDKELEDKEIDDEEASKTDTFF